MSWVSSKLPFKFFINVKPHPDSEPDVDWNFKWPKEDKTIREEKVPDTYVVKSLK
jgi:hypothetical protein